MRLQVQFDESDVIQLLECAEAASRRTDPMPPDWLMMLIKTVAPEQLTKAHKIPWKALKAATKEHRLRSFEYSRDEEPRYPS
jgi:hypothetical protein